METLLFFSFDIQGTVPLWLNVMRNEDQTLIH
jgi:hypothetical protein